MNIAAALAEIKALSVDERLEIMDAIWESIAAEPESVELSEAQAAEIDRRMAIYLTDPTKVVSWDDLEARIQKRLGR
jgi:putative addiction module component (TIGR02574 family)